MSGSGRDLKKRIFLNLDGTGQAAHTGVGNAVAGSYVTSRPVSNVARIGRATLLEDTQDSENRYEQIVYYQAGIGADAEQSMWDYVYESALGYGLESNVREAYGFLCNNYDYGDEIYITGFSRGAFTARSVAGLIGRVGILTKNGLDKFYEAFDYYKNWALIKGDSTKQIPVSPEAGTTRLYDPPNTKKPIQIRAVGVWDTVGGMGSDYFHDLALGPHVQNAYHMLSLNEKRKMYIPTLWEHPGKEAKDIKNFEQCWMPGDHSNIGGSWEEQQLSDISLAWMMSRFDALGVKFDENYLYREFTKFCDYVKFVGLKLPNTYASGPPYPADPSMYPIRQWGEGRSREITARWYKITTGGELVRQPTQYGKTGAPFPCDEGDKMLENTNETFHACLRYRRYCSNSTRLGAEDNRPFNPSNMKTSGWTYPVQQTDGRIGAGVQAVKDETLFNYFRTRKDKKTLLTQSESELGTYEKLYLAFYAQKIQPKAGESSIWTKVVGGAGPPKELTDQVNKIIANNPEGATPIQPPTAPTPVPLYSPDNTRKALQADQEQFDKYQALSDSFSCGDWNGDSQKVNPFNSLYPPEPKSTITNIVWACTKDIGNIKKDVISGFRIQQADGYAYSFGSVTTSPTIFAIDAMTFAEGSKIISIETKAGKFTGSDSVGIIGIKITDDKGNSQRRSSSAGINYGDLDFPPFEVTAPGPDYSLRGFYGDRDNANTAITRIGPVWGKGK